MRNLLIFFYLKGKKNLDLILICSLVILLPLYSQNVLLQTSHQNQKSTSIHQKNVFLTDNTVKIDGNGQLANLSSFGTGTKENPYIIQDYSINAFNQTCLTIQNTNKYFILQNVTTSNCNIGINFTNVTFGLLRNSTSINSLHYGFELDHSYNTTLEMDNANNNVVGFYVNDSYDSTIKNCMSTYTNISINTNIGIIISLSDNTFIFNNTILGNYSSQFSASTGIIIDASYNTTIDLEVVIDVYDNIHVDSSYNTTIINCILTGNDAFGIYFRSSNDNLIGNNTISDNSINPTLQTFGIALVNSQKNIVKDNRIRSKKDGVISSSEILLSNLNVFADNYIENCLTGFSTSFNDTYRGNVLSNDSIGFEIDGLVTDNFTNNIVTNSSKAAFRLDQSDDNNFLFNRISYSNFSFELISSKENSFINSSLSNNQYGFYLESSSLNLIQNSTITNNYYGIYLNSSMYNNFTNEYEYRNNYGIYFDHSYNNSVEDSYFSNNQHGIYLQASFNNTIENNIFFNNSETIFQGSGNFSNKLFNNTILHLSTTQSPAPNSNTKNQFLTNFDYYLQGGAIIIIVILIGFYFFRDELFTSKTNSTNQSIKSKRSLQRLRNWMSHKKKNNYQEHEIDESLEIIDEILNDKND